MSPHGKTDLVRRHDVDRAALRRAQRVSEGNTVIVFVDKRGRMVVADHALTASEIWFDRPKVMYEVDMGVHHDLLTLELPSVEEFSFHAEVALSWQVGDATKAIEARLTEAGPVYRPLVHQELRRISERFDIEDRAGAEHALNTEFVCERLALPHGVALRTCSVTLSVDADTRRHIAERTLEKRADEKRRRQHRERVADADLTAAEESAAHQLEELRKQNAFRLAAMQEEHDIAMRTMRMEFYDRALQDERYGLVKIRLEQAPDEVDSVIELVARQRQVPWEEARAFLATAIDGGLVGTKDLAGLVYQAAATLTEGMREGAARRENRPELAPHAESERDVAGADPRAEVRVERAHVMDGKEDEADERPV
ncbi:hypothetical protein ACFTXB_14460 [Streptomyces sp. NPDC057074]|uniref:hypothetical protein n=1 Tax=Streptomyces sp. NPDC057074 TaxID=3346015 RepID=UPI003627CFCD